MALKPQTYLNLLYLLLSFPQGMINFIITASALAVSLLGVILLISTLHLGNGLAWISGGLAVRMLGNTQEPLPGRLLPDPGWPKIDPHPQQAPA